MSNIVTFATFREALVHRRSVRDTMTVGTLGYGHMLVGVTGCTRDLAVLGFAGSERCVDSIMAGATKLRCRGGWLSQFQRLMCLVAGATV